MVQIDNQTRLQFLVVDENRTLALLCPNLVIQRFAPHWELMTDEIYLHYQDKRYRLTFTPYAGQETQ